MAFVFLGILIGTIFADCKATRVCAFSRALRGLRLCLRLYFEHSQGSVRLESPTYLLALLAWIDASCTACLRKLKLEIWGGRVRLASITSIAIPFAIEADPFAQGGVDDPAATTGTRQ